MAPLLPESVLKKRRVQEANAVKQAAASKERFKQARAAKRKTAFKRAEAFVKEFREKEADKKRVKRVTRCLARDRYPVPPGETLAVVVRLNGGRNIAPKAKKILAALRLAERDTAVFVRLNAKTRAALRLVTPFIAYGAPSLKSVRELIAKRGFGTVNDQRVAISDNVVVETALGAHGLVCVEDLVHEVATLGEHFEQATAFLAPFVLSHPTGKFEQETLRQSKAGHPGDKGERINELLAHMI
ncbi:ribosomal protein L30, ferredoxin-like fold domain-containing protein [Tribonema minus]|uniref:Ribosomal protein L30, ferredoxin-like fold domain-containing protein n=1 Tax=Tribonema minus TaxID=303371 RepID=A0A835YRQ3_9STRA|nr:ribosomal protein L30, ferredoxin-like fold domain-containing protein [Tribonema minus]